MTNQITTINPAEMPADELALAVREYQLAKLPADARVAIQIGEDDIIARGDALLTEASQITAVTDKATRAISARAILPASLSSVELQAAIDATHADLAAREWEEYAKQAKAAADATLAVLDVALALALEREATEARAREEAARAEAERLAREAAEREAREAAEREAARVAGLKARLVDLELSIARRIRAAASPQQARALVAELGQGVGGDDLGGWAEFAGDAAEIVRAGHADAAANLERLEAVAAAEARAASERAAREAAELAAAALASEKAEAERAGEFAPDCAAPEAPREIAADVLGVPKPAGEKLIRWGELCAAMGCEIPPWVLEQLGCRSEAGSYTVDALRSLRASLGDICARLDTMISE